MTYEFDVVSTPNVRYEKVGSQVVKHELNYVDTEKEHPLFVKARQFYLNQKWDLAKGAYEQLMSINPNNAAYHHTYACILSRYQGKVILQTLNQAQNHTAKAIKLEPDNIHYRLTNIKFLTDLQKNNKLHKEFQIVFKKLFTLPEIDNIDNAESAEKPVISMDLNVMIYSCVFEYYSHFLFVLAQHKDAIKYLQKSINIKKRFGVNVENRCLHDLAFYYLKTEELEKSLAIIEGMEQRKNSVWENFQSVSSPDASQLTSLRGEASILVDDYKTAYNCYKVELKEKKKDNTLHSSLIVYTQLIQSCIELKKFAEADILDAELFSMYSSNTAILQQASNKNIYWVREFLRGFYLTKKNGISNAMKAVKWMERTTKHCLNMNIEMGNRIPIAHFYLGLAYKNLSKYVKKEYYMNKAIDALFQSANLIPIQTKSIWEFALVLFESNEYYLCKQYAKQARNRCKQKKRIKTIYPKMKRKWKKQLKKLKCSYCGKHKYLMSKNATDKLKLCKGCHMVYYCNSKCQKLHWKQLHHNKCSKIWIKRNKKLLKTVENFSQFVPFDQLMSEYSWITSI